jgi:hypothetical protein
MEVHYESLHEEFSRLKFNPVPYRLCELDYGIKETLRFNDFLSGWIFAQEQFYGKKIEDIPEDAGVEG